MLPSNAFSQPVTPLAFMPSPQSRRVDKQFKKNIGLCIFIIQYGSGLKQRPTAVVLEVLSFDPEFFFLPMNIKTHTPMTERKDCFSGKHAQISRNMA